MFSTFFNDLEGGREYTLGKFADDTKLGSGCYVKYLCCHSEAGERDQWECPAAQQRKVPIFLRRNKPRHQYMLGAVHLENSLAEKDLGILEITKLTISQQRAFVARVANSTVGCSMLRITSRLAKVLTSAQYW